MIYTTTSWQRPQLTDDRAITQRVNELLQRIQSLGDAAIESASQQFDGFAPEVIELQAFEAYDLAPALADAIRTAAKRIERFARAQRAALTDIEFEDDYGRYAHQAVPLERIATYIPGGRYPLISTALMTLIPARVAGVAERIALSPSVNPALLAAASLAGATRLVRIGGAQAIAAAAFGSRWLPAVDMIVGPGNAYVAAAKAHVQTSVRIDTVAGPSEVLILADGDAPIDWLLEDAMAQGEHGPDALAVMVSSDRAWLEHIERALQNNPAGAILHARQQLQLVLAKDTADAVIFSNRFAPEHLMLCDETIDPALLTHYGALFIGAHSPVALGDYLSGPNHTLPTAGAARRSSGLSVLDFLRLQTVQQIHRGAPLYQAAAALADAEGLQHHATSLRLRTER